jgi:hypothetical protein
MLASVDHEMLSNATHYLSQVVALYESLFARLLGICLASFSSGNPDLVPVGIQLTLARFGRNHILTIIHYLQSFCGRTRR